MLVNHRVIEPWLTTLEKKKILYSKFNELGCGYIPVYSTPVLFIINNYHALPTSC